LENFYANHGFETISEMYLEDDIPHVDMRFEK
ncbi:GNAT family N-acetyltransferase, partial [Vibrio splendidus]